MVYYDYWNEINIMEQQNTILLWMQKQPLTPKRIKRIHQFLSCHELKVYMDRKIIKFKCPPDFIRYADYHGDNLYENNVNSIIKNKKAIEEIYLTQIKNDPFPGFCDRKFIMSTANRMIIVNVRNGSTETINQRYCTNSWNLETYKIKDNYLQKINNIIFTPLKFSDGSTLDDRANGIPIPHPEKHKKYPHYDKYMLNRHNQSKRIRLLGFNKRSHTDYDYLNKSKFYNNTVRTLKIPIPLRLNNWRDGNTIIKMISIGNSHVYILIKEFVSYWVTDKDGDKDISNYSIGYAFLLNFNTGYSENISKIPTPLTNLIESSEFDSTTIIREIPFTKEDRLDAVKFLDFTPLPTVLNNIIVDYCIL
ncbi:MAG: hypothetical protein Edafosvirus19_18 [Edafosvirus sp.]|uniref:Uncharacterized protein n=1 Tax=Edafosvirus sp. TaxID=2487765 RepID=A0A3G4ZX65_9VIRU|nr:MAG: hypothetical protein Edafosvirus19_18 [Edafosvirus sp.]